MPYNPADPLAGVPMGPLNPVSVSGRDPNQWARTLMILGATLKDVGAGIGGRPQTALALLQQMQEDERLRKAQEQFGQTAINTLMPIPGVNVSPPLQPGQSNQGFDYGGPKPPSNGALAGLAAQGLSAGVDPSPYLKIGQMLQPPPAEEYTLNEGDVRYRDGKPIASNPKPAAPPDPNKLLNPDGTVNKAYLDAQMLLAKARAPQTSVKVENQGPIAQGYRRVTGKDGSVYDEVIPGSPAAREIEAQQRKADTQQQQRGVVADVVTTDIGRAIDIIKNATIPVTGAGSIFQRLPGSSANDVRALISTVKSNVGFDRLQAMRDASPTGGALGQVAIPELQMLQAAVGSLEQSQSQDQLLFNLQRVNDIYNLVVHGRVAQGAPQPSDDDLLKKYGVN